MARIGTIMGMIRHFPAHGRSKLGAPKTLLHVMLRLPLIFFIKECVSKLRLVLYRYTLPQIVANRLNH